MVLHFFKYFMKFNKKFLAVRNIFYFVAFTTRNQRPANSSFNLSSFMFYICDDIGPVKYKERNGMTMS